MSSVLDVNNLCEWKIFQKLHVGCFEWVEETSQLSEDFIKDAKNKVIKSFFFELILSIQRNCKKVIIVYIF